MTSDTSSFNNGLLINSPPSFDGEIFDIWKERINIFVDVIDNDLWNFILDDPFVHIHFVNNEVVDKSNYLWTT